MFSIFKSKKVNTPYTREQAKQSQERLKRSKLRLAVIADKLRSNESLHNVDLALEMHDLIVYIENHTARGDFSLGIPLSDCDTLRANTKLGENKYTIETTNTGI